MRRVDWKDVVAGVSLLGVVSICATAVYWEELSAPEREVLFSPKMSIRELAEKNGVRPKALVHMLSHEDHGAWTWARRIPVGSLPVDPESVRHALEHAVEEAAPGLNLLRFVLWGAYLTACLGLLTFARATRRLRTILLLGTVMVFGVVLGSSPNPMEAVVKAFKAMRGMTTSPLDKAAILGLFSLMVVIGNKLICGWACQLGALQDSLHVLSPFGKAKRWHVPFWLANGIRVALFLLFLDLMLGGVLGIENFIIYHHLNFFKLYSWGLAPLAQILLPVFAVLSLFVYRPFCQFICPFGLFSWILENISVYRVRINRSLCNHCEKCVTVCPTEAMAARLHRGRHVLLPDCWACGACIEACPASAIVFDRIPPSSAAATPVSGEE